VTIADDAALAWKREQELLQRIRKGEPNAQYAAGAYPTGSLGKALLRDLAAEDRDVATKAAHTLYQARQLPADAAAFVTRAMTRQLALEGQRLNRRTDVLVYLALLAARLGSEEALPAVLALAHSDIGGGARRQGVDALVAFRQERATRELHGFRADGDEEVRFAAARALAERRDGAAVAVLVAWASDAQSGWRGPACRALANYPNDGRAEAALRSRLTDADSAVRDEADRALEELLRARKR
jgi:HEAT repeat protein